MRKQANIIWVFGDQHRAQAMSCMGDPNVSTPHMDQMGVHGVNFRGAIANNPWCCPFRGTLMTGRYSHNCVYKKHHGSRSEHPHYCRSSQ